MSCLCLALLVAALVFLGAAAIAFVGQVLLLGSVLAAIGLVLLVIWMAVCRDCPTISFLKRFFLSLAGLMGALAVLLLLFGQFGAALGAAATAIFFLVVAGVLRAGEVLLGCP
jgi:hypothetical protein